ncbi:MAG: hypothetical protein IT258_04945 [Saprospiraceae bacterium]|nr:hypothetical protein [Saprospiraceae bacterium]
MKKCYAWLLLLITTVQWVGGHLCYEISYFVEEERVMDQPERTISEEIYEETGLEAYVEILPQGQRHKWGLDYGNYFAYEKKDSTGTVAYMIDFGPRSVTWEQVAGPNPANQTDDANSMALAKFLFGAFFFEPTSHLYAQKKSQPDSNFSLSTLNGRMSTTPTSPPPDFHC